MKTKERKRIGRRGILLGTLLAVVMAAGGFAMSETPGQPAPAREEAAPVAADSSVTAGDFTLTGENLTENTDYTFDTSARILAIQTLKPVTVRNTTAGSETSDRILIKDMGAGNTVNLTLAGVKIKATSGSALTIQYNAQCNVIITLADGSENILTGGNTGAGLLKSGVESSVGKLTIQGQAAGTGRLEANGGQEGAGIGGNQGSSGGNIIIKGGIVKAIGGEDGAGIGGGLFAANRGGDGTDITISGGTVEAKGGANAAGIGGGYRNIKEGKGIGRKITIEGGTVKAIGGNLGAGIGGGSTATGSEITICGDSKVEATGGNYGAGIGGGTGATGSVITIQGNCEVVATGGIGAAGIGGGGNGGSGSKIEITGGMVNAKATGGGDGIGNGKNGTGSQENALNGNAVVLAASDSAHALSGFDAGLTQGIAFTQEGTGDWTANMYGSSVAVTADATFPAHFTVERGKTLIVNEGVTVTAPADVTLNNQGTLQNKGTLKNQGTLTNEGTLENTNTGTLTNENTLTNTTTGALTNEGTLENTDTGELKNQGTLTNKGTINNAGTIDNQNTLNIVSGTIICTGSGTVTTKVSYQEEESNAIADRDVLYQDKNGAKTYTSADLPTPGAKEGYTFKNWCSDSARTKNIAVGDSVQINTHTLYAKWELNDCKVTFNVNGHGTAPAEQDLKYGDKVTKPADPTETGWTFGGWYKDNTTFLTPWDFNNDTVKDNITLYAKWEANDCKVTFHVNGHGTAPAEQDLKYGDKVTKPADPTETGWTFGGWYKDNTTFLTPWDFNNDTVKDNMTLYAKWEANDCKVTFNVNGHGTAPAEQDLKYGDKITKPADPTETGWTFGGWYKDNTTFLTPWDFNNDTVKDNMTLYAKWTETIYTVTFDTKGGSPSPWETQVREGQPVSEPSTKPTKTGYTFQGWYENGNPYDFSAPVMSDLTIYAAWLGNEHTISVPEQPEGGTIEIQEKARTGDAVTFTATPDSGYRMKGTPQVSATDAAANGSIPVIPTGNANEYQFTMENSDVTVMAEFELAPQPSPTPTPTPDPGKGGNGLSHSAKTGDLFVGGISFALLGAATAAGIALKKRK